MSKLNLKRCLLKNFKCHDNFECELKNMNILTGSNASGKSSLIQALLLAVKAWNDCDKKKINTNNVYGINLGLPLNIFSEDFEDGRIKISLFVNDLENKVLLSCLDGIDKFDFDIDNYEEIAILKEKKETLASLNVFFVCAERKGPRVFYEIDDIVPFYVGLDGKNTGYVLSEMDKLQKLESHRFCIPDKLQRTEIGRFSANCEAWLNYIVPETGFTYNVDGEKGIVSVKLKNQGEYYAPIATGFGITYVLPIVVQAMAASMVGNSVLIVENPEAHLHPLSQSRLGRFLALVSENGVQVIVETHSEHVVDGCRIRLSKDNMCKECNILFFSKSENHSACQNIAVDDNGELIEWPKGFFDQKRFDLRELLGMRLCGN